MEFLSTSKEATEARLVSGVYRYNTGRIYKAKRKGWIWQSFQNYIKTFNAFRTPNALLWTLTTHYLYSKLDIFHSFFTSFNYINRCLLCWVVRLSMLLRCERKESFIYINSLEYDRLFSHGWYTLVLCYIVLNYIVFGVWKFSTQYNG